MIYLNIKKNYFDLNEHHIINIVFVHLLQLSKLSLSKRPRAVWYWTYGFLHQHM